MGTCMTSKFIIILPYSSEVGARNNVQSDINQHIERDYIQQYIRVEEETPSIVQKILITTNNIH